MIGTKERRQGVSGPSRGLAALLATARRSSAVLLGTRASLQDGTPLHRLLDQLGKRAESEPQVLQLFGRGELSESGSQDPLPEETRAWIDAADLHEKVLAAQAAGDTFDFVFCLDPWAAFILSRGRTLWPEATWIYVSNPSLRKGGGDAAYWEEVDRWMRGLPFDDVVPVESLLGDNQGIQSGESQSHGQRQALGRVTDPDTYRSIFAEPGEHLIVCYAPKDGHCPLETVLGAAREAARSGGRIRWIALTDQPTPSERLPYVYPIDLSAKGILGELASVADALVLGAPIEGALRPNVPVLVAAKQGCTTVDPVQGAIRFDPGSPESLISRLPISPPSQGVTNDSRRPSRQAKKDGAFVLENNWGIGDELLLSAVAREVKRAWPETRLWIRSRFGFRFPEYVRRGDPPRDAQRVETIYQNAVLYGPEAHAPFPGHLVQQMLDKFYLDTGLHVEARDVRPELSPDEKGKRELRHRSVVLHSRPNPRLPSKDWGLSRWERLTEILHSHGITPVQVGAPGEPLLPYAEDERKIPLRDVPELVARSAATVCLVGFLMHVAAATRTPAVVIYGGREHPAIDGYPDQVHLSSGPLPCRGRWGCHLGPEVSCPNDMRCMEELTPELVAAEVLRLLNIPSPGSTS